MTADANALAQLPRVDHVLGTDALASHPWDRALKRRAVTEVLAELRRTLDRTRATAIPTVLDVAARVVDRLTAWQHANPRRVVNATGVLLHTNLGRAPLSGDAVRAMAEASGACDLEFDVVSGRRQARLGRLSAFLAALVGADAAFVCNNNAAALLLACTALATQGPIALSRGQMVEIGDGFRVLDIVAAAGCEVASVGSTNRTHLEDYAAALAGARGEAARAILWVHPSNFVQRGFVAHPPISQLSRLARAQGVPLIADLGSGSLGYGVPGSGPTVRTCLHEGADLVLASADKLFGGPQAGIMVGATSWIDSCRRHPLARALRIDKVAMAGLHATACAHAYGGVPELPLHAMIEVSVEQLRMRAQAWLRTLQSERVAVIETQATVGGGTLPGETLPSVGIRVADSRPETLAGRLRMGDPAVVGRIDHGHVVLDLRTVPEEADTVVLSALMRALRGDD